MTCAYQAAHADLFCGRWQTLDIPSQTILEGQSYILMQHNNLVIPCCMDCWERLCEEVRYL